jgi:DNA-binding beta-propeller fold protein YncE
VIDHFAVSVLPQHVVPSWDLRRIYVTNDKGNTLTPINPKTGKRGADIPVDDPYNLYFTPNGRFAIVVAEAQARLDFRNPQTMALDHSIQVPCRGIDHMDFSADGSYLIASCEFSGQVLKVDVQKGLVIGALTLGNSSNMPQDVKMSPDGRVFYVADMRADGVWEVNGRTMRKIGFIKTGRGAHGLYPSRDAKVLYVSNRDEGSISVISFKTRRVVAKWQLPGGGTPDMGGVSPDGKVLWLSGRSNSCVYAISTANGSLLAKIPVGTGPHGLLVWPQPGRYSLGHTGILR